MEHLSPRELHSWLNDKSRPAPLLVDVREGWEVNVSKIEGAQHIPMGSIPAAVNALPQAEPIVVVCQHGVRSMKVAGFLKAQGCSKVFNLSGGMSAWNQDVATA